LQTNERQAKQLQVLEDDRNRAQAEKVAAWPHVGGRIAVRNASDVPVYNACLIVQNRTFGDWDAAIRMEDILPPGQELVNVGKLYGAEIAGVPDQYRVVVLFRDAANRLWRRGHDGTLEELSMDDSNQQCRYYSSTSS
jgi:hypothetical protein